MSSKSLLLNNVFTNFNTEYTTQQVPVIWALFFDAV